MNDYFVIEDVETLKALAHPQRLSIIRQLRKSRTVKEVAELLDEDPTKLYYHVRLLEKVGVIEVTETNVVSGIIEKQYRAVAKAFKVHEKLITDDDSASDNFVQIAQAMLDSTLYSLRQSLDAELFDRSKRGIKHNNAFLSSHASLTKEQRDEFAERLSALLDDAHRWSEDNESVELPTYKITVAFFQMAEEPDE